MWLLSDYGGVLCHHQSEEDIAAMAGAAKMTDEEFADAYWRYRAEYDRADLSPEDYWKCVLGYVPSREHLKRLDDLDLKSWSRPNTECVARYRELRNDFDLALLSNAPTTLARKVEQFEWMPRMRHMFFSCDLRLTKPSPEIYLEMLRRLEAPSETILFVDDRLENIEAAAAAGMRTILFRDANDMDATSESV